MRCDFLLEVGNRNMSKVFQVIDGVCHWQTPYSRKIDINPNKYPPAVMEQFIETDNDLVFESWGYDYDTQTFIKPTAPEGWLYDDKTGTFYKDGEAAPSENTPDKIIERLRIENTKQAATIKALTSSAQTLEDCLVEMAGVVYA